MVATDSPLSRFRRKPWGPRPVYDAATLVVAVGLFVLVGVRCHATVAGHELWQPMCGLAALTGVGLTVAWAVRRRPGLGRLAALVLAGAVSAGGATAVARAWQVSATMARLPALHAKLVATGGAEGRWPDAIDPFPEARTALGWGDENFGYLRTGAGYCVTFRSDPATTCLACGDAQAAAAWSCEPDTF